MEISVFLQYNARHTVIKLKLNKKKERKLAFIMRGGAPFSHFSAGLRLFVFGLFFIVLLLIFFNFAPLFYCPCSSIPFWL